MSIRKGKYSSESKYSSEKTIGVALFKLRVYALFFLILGIGVIIFFRLYSLQVLSYSSFKALSDNQHSVLKQLVPERGEIFMKDREDVYPAAVNKATKMAYAVPKEIKNLDDAINFLSGTLGIDKGELKDKLDRPNDMYEVLKHRLNDEEIQKINEGKVDGIRLSDESYRYYPGGELGSNVLGYVGWSGDKLGGKYGIEQYFENDLKGQEGQIFQNRDTAGRWIAIGERVMTPARDGDDLVLTIDHIVQFETEKILEGAVKKFEANGGSIIVMDPGSGKILSMASYPTFNPNDYSEVEDMTSFRNLAVNDAYESGSVFKTITLAAALDSGKITPDTTYTDTGMVKEAGYSIQNSDYKAYGLQTMTNVLEKSLNTGAIFAEKSIGNKNFSDYVKRFGFGELTGIDLFGETPGNIRNLDNLKSNIQFFTASFGQGITVTPLQMICAYGAIANNGVLMKPEIVEKIIHHGGKAEEDIEPEEVRRVISPQAARETTQMLVSVVQNGHGKRAGVPGYLIGGKTGTAQVASSQEKGYEEGRNIGSFVGFGPTDDPKFVIAVRINDPKAVEWAESSAAPAFGELMKFLLEYYNIQPTEEYTQKDLDDFNAYHDLSEFSLQEDKEDLDGDKNQKDGSGDWDEGNNMRDKKKSQ